MKQLTISLLLILASFYSFSQSKIQFGAYAEGGSFFPKETPLNQRPQTNGFSSGAGIYISTVIWGNLSASLGAGYRYKFNKQTETSNNLPYYYSGVYGGYGYSSYGGYGSYDPGSYYNYETPSKRYNYPQSYVTLPLKLKYSFGHLVFLETGVEASRLLNYKYVKEDTEFDWLVGIGCDKYRLHVAIEYVQGFRIQKMWDIQGYSELGESFRNRMLMLNLSYPIFGSKE